MKNTIEVKKVGEISVNLHQEREYKTMKVTHETASLTRVIEYVENGKAETRKLSVSVYARGEFGKKPTSYEINWSAIGSVPVEFATAYAEMLTEAVRVAGKLTEAYIK